MSDNIHVAVRMRPLISREIESKAAIHWNAQRTSTICQSSSPAVAFHFDRVFQGHENNEVVYSEFCSPIVKSVIDGFNGTIFAYGQTSSGKTFTMMGDDKTSGVIQYTISDIFTFIQDMPEREFLLRVSYMEIYNEMVRDLLSDKNDKNENLKLHEDQYGLIKVSGLSEHIVQEADQVLRLMKQAESKRRTGETRMNEKSSRSHSIFRMIIESGIKGEADAAVNVSQFNLVDLAGSERARQTGAKGARFKESININKSLLMLSQVISHLSEKVLNDYQFINYRDSKLTRILQNSLGGNARTAIICTVTPACLDETMSTLKFAERAKNIKNKPEVNEVLTEQALLKQYANKIKKLTKELEATKEEKAQQNKSLQEQIQNLQKNYVFQITPGIKSRSTRRETWGGCLDAARLRLDTLVPRKPLTSADMTLEDEFLKGSVTPKRKLMPPFEERSSMPCPLRNRFLSSDLPTLEEEGDCDLDTFGDDSSFSQSSKVFLRQSYEAPRHSDAIFQTDLELSNQSTLQSELIQNLKERIKFLEKELSELIDVTTLERQLHRSKKHSLNSTSRLSLDVELVSEVNQEEHLNPLDPDKTKHSQFEAVNLDANHENVNKCDIRSVANILTQDPVFASDCVLETENIDDEVVFQSKSILPDVKMQSSLPDCSNEEFYEYLGSTLKMLGVRKSIDLFPVKDNLNDHYKVMLDMFNLIMQYQCLTFKGSFKTNISKKINEISSDLTRVFQSFSGDCMSGDTTEDMVEDFISKTDGVLKEIDLCSLDDVHKHEVLNQSLYNESFLQRNSFDDSVINVSNVKSPRFSPLGTIAEGSISNTSELLSTSMNTDVVCALQFTNENDLKERIITLEKDIQVYQKSVLDLEYECELKDKQVLIFKDKMEIQEKIIDGLKDELVFKSDAVNNLNIGTVKSTDSSSQTLEEWPLKVGNVDFSSQTIKEMSIVGVADLFTQTLPTELTDSSSQTLEEWPLKVGNVDCSSQTIKEMPSLPSVGVADLFTQTLPTELADSSSQTLEEWPCKNLYVDCSSQTIEETPYLPNIDAVDQFTQTSELPFDGLLNCSSTVKPTAYLSEKLTIEDNTNFKDDLNSDLHAPNIKDELQDIKINDEESKTKDDSYEESLRVVEEYEEKMKEAQSQVEANLRVTLNDLLELRIFALEFMKREMKKFLGDVEFLENSASSPLLDQIKIEITALKELLVRLEFYVKNQNEHTDYFNGVLEKNMLENGTLKEQLKQVELSLEKHLKEKDAKQSNLNEVLLDMDSSISELMRNVKDSESVRKTCYVDYEETKYMTLEKNKPVRYIELMKKKILSLSSIINKNNSLVADLSVKLQETEDNLKNFEEKEQQSVKLTKSLQTIQDNRLQEMSRKLEEADVCLEDLKKEINSLTHELEIMNSEKEALEDKLHESNSTVKKMREDFEVDKLNWSVNTIECVKKVEEKCDQMMIEQENKFFDEMDKLTREHKAQILKRNENYKVESEQWHLEMEELRKQHQISMDGVKDKWSQEINDRYSERSKLEEQISTLKEKICNITQLNSFMKDKYKKYSAQMQQKLKEKVNKCIQEKETQTLQSEILKENPHIKTVKDNPIHMSEEINVKPEQCSQCKVLMQKISRLQISKQQETPDIVREMETNKILKKELSDLRCDIVSAKTKNTTLITENESLKQELSSKLVLLRSCHCRLNPKPSDTVTDEENQLAKLETSAHKKRKIVYEGTLEEAKSSDFRNENIAFDSADILKNEVVQRAIREEAKSLQMAALNNGSGPDGIVKCAYLNQKLKKKDKELEKKNKELEILKRELANNVYSSKRHAVETLENRPVNAVEEKKAFRPFHPFPQGVVPKVQPKKILKEVNRNDPSPDNAMKAPTPKKNNMYENKGKDPEYEKRRQLERLTGESECKQQ